MSPWRCDPRQPRLDEGAKGVIDVFGAKRRYPEVSVGRWVENERMGVSVAGSRLELSVERGAASL